MSQSEDGIAELAAAGLARTWFRFGTSRDQYLALAVAEDAHQDFQLGTGGAALAAVLTNDLPSIRMLLGSLLSGVSLVSIPLPGRGGPLQEYVAGLMRVSETLGTGPIVARDDIAQALQEAGLKAVSHSTLRASALPSEARGFRLTQFSSGSTREPRGVELSDGKLGANVRRILEVIEPEEGDRVMSWLPLSHDMGLVGMVLSSIAGFGAIGSGCGSIHLLEPESFLRNPSSWIVQMAEARTTVTAAPNVGYRLACKRSVSQPISLSSLRCAIVGGEQTSANTLSSFVQHFAYSGFSSNAFCPAYGLAELGLAASMTRPVSPWRSIRVDRAKLAEHLVVEPGDGTEALALVSAGAPLRGYEIGSGDRLDAAFGELSIRGPSIGLDAISGGSLADEGGRLPTGDLGFCRDGEVFVCGRSDDYLVVNGRNNFLPPMELDIALRIKELGAGRIAMAAQAEGGFLVVCEADSAMTTYKSTRLRRLLRGAVVESVGAAPERILLVPRGRLPVTSSGKLRRHLITQEVENVLD